MTVDFQGWRLTESGDDDAQLFIRDKNDDIIAEVRADWPMPARAYGQLMTAAPQLLGAAGVALCELDPTSKAHEMLLNAVRNATGRPPERP